MIFNANIVSYIVVVSVISGGHRSLLATDKNVIVFMQQNKIMKKRFKQ